MPLMMLLALSAPLAVAQDAEVTAVEAKARQGSVVFLGMDSDPTLHPSLKRVPVEQVVPVTGVSEADEAALERLSAEFEAVRPLVDEFDGELAIMSRLKAATAEVHTLRNEADRELVYQALLYEGFAVQRYFQDTLATDPAAAPYRAELHGKVVPKAWVDAAGLQPDRKITAAEIPEEPERIAYDSVRAEIQLAPKATLRVVGAPPGAQVSVDGGAPQPTALGASVAPGRHFVQVVLEEELIARGERRLEAEEEWLVEVPAMMSDFDRLASALSEEPQAVALEDRLVQALMGASKQPMHVIVPGRRGPLLYVLEGSSLVLVPDRSSGDEDARVAFDLSAGMGWMYDGDWYLSKPLTTPATKATVNAALPVLGANLSVRTGPLSLGAGVDLGIPVGADNTLASGDGTLRLRTHPYLSVGVPQAQLTAGYLFPWHLAVGARGSLPVGEHWRIGGAVIYGMGLPQDQPDNPETGVFDTGDVVSTWAFISRRFGLGG